MRVSFIKKIPVAHILQYLATSRNEGDEISYNSLKESMCYACSKGYCRCYILEVERQGIEN